MKELIVVLVAGLVIGFGVGYYVAPARKVYVPVPGGSTPAGPIGGSIGDAGSRRMQGPGGTPALESPGNTAPGNTAPAQK
jgi:hypothetical protein